MLLLEQSEKINLSCCKLLNFGIACYAKQQITNSSRHHRFEEENVGLLFFTILNRRDSYAKRNYVFKTI